MKKLLVKTMRWLLVLVCFSFATISTGQNKYRIGNVFWEYKKPENYKPRIDNFSSTIKRGDSMIKELNVLDEQTNSDVILVSAARHDSIDINVVLGSYKSNADITKFTLKGYVGKYIEFMKYSYEQLKSDAEINLKEILIDKVRFFVVETKIYHKDMNYTYWTKMYIADLGGKEFNISVVFDNEKDKQEIEASILNSKFTSL